MPLEQSELANALGLSNVRVNRVLQARRGNGLITLRCSSLVVDCWNDLVLAGEFDLACLNREGPAVG